MIAIFFFSIRVVPSSHHVPTLPSKWQPVANMMSMMSKGAGAARFSTMFREFFIICIGKTEVEIVFSYSFLTP